MKHLLIAGATVVLLLPGCQSPTPTFSEEEKAAVAAEIAAARDVYFEAATSLDADAMVAMWDQDFLHISNASILPLTGEAMAESWRALDRIEMDITSDRVVALCRNAGYTMSTASYVVYDSAGVAVASSVWAGTHIWHRTAEGWLVHAVHEGR